MRCVCVCVTVWMEHRVVARRVAGRSGSRGVDQAAAAWIEGSTQAMRLAQAWGRCGLWGPRRRSRRRCGEGGGGRMWSFRSRRASMQSAPCDNVCRGSDGGVV